MKILIVEDEPTSAKVLAAALNAYGTVTMSASPVDAFDIYAEAVEMGKPFDLICLDLELPEFDGLEFLDEIRRGEVERGVKSEQGVKVIITTGHYDADTYVDANAAGCDAFLSKPVDREKLRTEMMRLGLTENPSR